jgi:hypothetical protein
VDICGEPDEEEGALSCYFCPGDWTLGTRAEGTAHPSQKGCQVPDAHSTVSGLRVPSVNTAVLRFPGKMRRWTAAGTMSAPVPHGSGLAATGSSVPPVSFVCCVEGPGVGVGTLHPWHSVAGSFASGGQNPDRAATPLPQQ